VLPDVDIRARVKLKRAIVDRYCVLPPGLEAGLDPAADRKRFHVTPNGITLITPGMLGQEVHHLR
jgi:glucose-1-phosphate adenylyltransferase